MANEERNSNIEVLRMIAMIMIVASHAANYINRGEAWLTGGGSLLSIQLLGIGGQLGVTIFVAISSWFLCDANSFSTKKILKLIWSVWSGCVLFCIIDKVFSLKLLDGSDLIKELITPFYSQYWFVTTYIMFALLEPFLRNYIRSLCQEQLKAICIVLCALVFVYNMVFLSNPGYHLADFICIYVLTCYVKRYRIEILYKHAGAIAFVSWLGLFILIHVSGKCLNMINHGNAIIQIYNRLWSINPIIFTIAISLLIVFGKNKKCNQRLNRMAKSTLGVYIIHENLIFRGDANKDSLLWIGFLEFNKWFNDSYWFVLYYSGCVVLVFFSALFMEMVRSFFLDKILFDKLRFVDRICKKIDSIYVTFKN